MVTRDGPSLRRKGAVRTAYPTRLPQPSPSLYPPAAPVGLRKMTPTHPPRKSSLQPSNFSLLKSLTTPNLSTIGPHTAFARPSDANNPSGSPPRRSHAQSTNPFSYTDCAPNGDLSGPRPQFHIRGYSNQFFSSSNASTSTIAKPPKYVLKSESSSTLNYQPVTPQRGLMRPLDPPLPRNQTLRSLSGNYGGGSANASPTKSSITSLDTNGSEVGVMEALLESRMTRDELDEFNRVARQVETRKASVQKVESAKPASKRFYTSVKEKDMSQSSFKFSRGKLRRSSMVDIAELCRSGNTSPSDSPMPSPFHKSTAETQEDLEMLEVRLVATAQPAAYWLGRFSALLDGQRTADHHAQAKAYQRTRSPESFEKAESRRSHAAITELKSCCTNEEARDSLQSFAEQYVLVTKTGKHCGPKRPTMPHNSSTSTSHSTYRKPTSESGARRTTLGGRLASSGQLAAQAVGLAAVPTDDAKKGEGRRESNGSGKETFKGVFATVKKMRRSLTGGSSEWKV